MVIGFIGTPQLSAGQIQGLPLNIGKLRRFDEADGFYDPFSNGDGKIGLESLIYRSRSRVSRLGGGIGKLCFA